jgi:hypothetical protein
VYPLRDFEGSPEWAPKAEGGADGQLADAGDAYLFLHDTYVVTRGVHVDRAVVFDAVTPTWVAFCRDQLGFDPPAWLKAGA